VAQGSHEELLRTSELYREIVASSTGQTDAVGITEHVLATNAGPERGRADCESPAGMGGMGGGGRSAGRAGLGPAVRAVASGGQGARQPRQPRSQPARAA